MGPIVSHRPGMRAVWSVVVTGLLFGLLAATTTPAQALEVRVRALSALNADVTAAGTTVRVSGTLRDELDIGLPQRKITIEYRHAQGGEVEATETLYTDRRGSFRTHKELAPGGWHVSVRFEETEHVTESSVVQTIEIEPGVVDLRVQAPGLVVGQAEVPVRMRASVDGVGLQSRARIYVGETLAGEVELDQFGRGKLDVSDALEPGVNPISVRIGPGQYRKPAQVGVRVRLPIPLVVSSLRHAAASCWTPSPNSSRSSSVSSVAWPYTARSPTLWGPSLRPR